MSCRIVGNTIVCAPTSFNYRRVMWCPTCEQRRLHLIEMFVWYSPSSTCLTCGDTWDPDEGRYQRPFARGWRAEAVRQAKATPYTTKAAALAALRAEAP